MRTIILVVFAAFLVFIQNGMAQQIIYRQTANPALKTLKSLTDTKELAKELKRLKSSRNEQDIVTLYDYYRTTEDQKEKAEEIKKIGLKRFPHGDFDFREKLTLIQKEEDYNKKQELFEILYAAYPNKSYGFLIKNLADHAAQQGDDAKMKLYTDLFFKELDTFVDNYNKFDRDALIRAQHKLLLVKNPEAAQLLLKSDLDRLQKKVLDVKSQPSIDWKELNTVENDIVTAQIVYLEATSRGTSSLEGFIGLQKLYTEVSLKKLAAEDIQEQVAKIYLESALKNKEYKVALPLMAKAIQHGDNTPMLRDRLKEVYVGAYGSEIGYTAYVRELDKAYDVYLTAKIREKLIDQESPDFVLKDFDGNIVKLSELRGKTVILDFWATWCGPCVASFPAMQKAVDHFKNDPNVVFLFVHTFERSKDPTIATQEAKALIKEGGYTFKVLMDTRNPETKANDAAKSFGFNSIPTKIIIDANGRIRFKSTGASLDPKALVDEFTKMVEMLNEG